LARRFVLRAKTKHRAIDCDDKSDPVFGSGADILVYDNCNASTHSGSFFGVTYTNDTGLDKRIVFTGSQYFQVSEIEVFEITG
jgi:hypothetical protein